jgi:PAS domain S-box-containing protein
MNNEVEKWRRRFERERAARLEAEQLLEVKSYELYTANEQLRQDTEKQESAIAAAAAEIHKLSLVARRSTNAIIMTNPDGRIEWANESFERITGYSPDEVKGRRPGEFLQGPATDPATVEQIRKALRQRESCTVEILNYHKDGRSYWITLTINPVFSAEGELLHFFAIQSDTTEEREIREQLEYSERRFRDIVAAAGEYVWEINLKGRFTYVSRYAESVLGCSREEIVRCPVTKFVPREEIDHLRAWLRELGREPHPFSNHIQKTLRPDGKLIWQRVAGVPIFADDGSVLGFRGMARDITEERRVNEALVAERDFARKVMDSMGQGLTVTNADGTLRFANQRFLDLLETTLEDLVQKTPYDWTDPADHRRLRESHSRRKEGKSSSYETRLISTRGERIEVMLTGVPLFDKGKFIGAITVVTDLRRRLEMERSMREEKERAEDLNRQLQEQIHRAEQLQREAESANNAKSQFLANMSHELRTPLNAILGMTEAMLDRVFGDLDERQISSLETIQRSGRHLLDLISEILDLSKIEAGRLTLEKSPTDPVSLARQCLGMVRPLAERKQVSLDSDFPPSTPTLALDERRLRQALLNLLGNAVKFTPDGGRITLAVGWSAETASSPSELTFTVSDSGIGIAQDDLERVFKPFHQVENHLTRQHEGTGLLLALVRNLVELHGGRVSVASRLGQGSRFTLHFPNLDAASAKSPTLPPVQGTPNPDRIRQPAFNAPSQTRRILYAEDNEANLATLGAYLEAHRFEVIAARDGFAALEAFAKEPVDCVLVDIQMPGLDGFEMMQRLRATPEGASVPIIAVTALAAEEDRQRCLAVGANDVFTKPLALRKLLDRIRELVATPPPSRRAAIAARHDSAGDDSSHFSI